MPNPVIIKIVDNNLCIGCGLCAALCPKDLLAMQWNQYGEYNPVEFSPCTIECGICAKVCPFFDASEDEDVIGERLYGSVQGIRHRSETGYYIGSYVGYSDRHRLTSASGGLASWILEELLNKGVVDYVICVASASDPDRLFKFTVFNTIEGIRTGAGSAYYPVEMSEIIRQILKVPGRYAVTGLPCFIKAIRLAQVSNKKLQERIIVTIGLVCGQLKSKHFTEYIAILAGVNGEIGGVHCRGKSPDQPASNFHYTFTPVKGEKRKIFWRDGISEAWTNRWFTPNACNYCDDVFAECADGVCMDAWLPEYSNDSSGMSLVLVRSPTVQSILDEGKGICLDHISIEKVIQSQAGVIAQKRDHLAYRLFLRENNVPVKRVSPVKICNFFSRKEIEIKEQIQIISREEWREEKGDANRIRKLLKKNLNRLFIQRMISIIVAFPSRVVGYIVRKLR